MKKVIILQNMQNALGGVNIVNEMLSNEFVEKGNKVYIISIRDEKQELQTNNNKDIIRILINKKQEWGLIKKNQIIDCLRNKKILAFIKMIIKRYVYKISLFKDYIKTKKEIKKINPDIIIVSHYELLKSIPRFFLKNTIMHYHTSFNEVKNNKNNNKIFNKYQNKIAKFVWLSSSTKQLAIESGYQNSTYIYNPIKFKTNKIAPVTKNKTLIYLGRFSKEKRLEILIKLVDEIFKDKKFKEWKFNIYGEGTIDEKALSIIEKSTQINLYGKTKEAMNKLLKSSINLNSSKFEGFSMTILEAMECGIPTITFNYGESVKEQIKNHKTGIIIEQDNCLEYKNKLTSLMSNEDLLLEMSQNCKKYSEEFDLNSIVESWQELFDEIKNKE